MDRGCAGEFELFRGGRPGYGQGPSYRDPGYGYGSDRVVRCESDNFRRRFCNIGPARDVRLVRQISRTTCVEGRNWGWSRDQLWVEGGCAGEFELR